MKTPLLTTAIFLTTHLLPVTASPPPNSPSTYLAQTADGEDNLKTPQEVQAQAQKITVRITAADKGGSGVLIAKKGTTYLVLTNKHVVGKGAKFQIQTPDGQKHAAQLVPNTQIDPKYDAVLLQFTSRQTYTLANLKYDTGTPLTEGREIYSAGFPFDSERLRFTTGAVTQLSDVPLEDGTQIGYITNPGQKGIRQGMSGGPVLDGNGAVIGINTIGAAPILPSYTYFDGSKPLPTKATEYAKANWGVPIYNVLTQLNPDILYNYENLPKVQRQVTPQGYMAELNRKARQQTVRIEYQDIKNGSGVIVAKEGNTYYVLTAKHVVWDSKNKSFHSNIKTITDDQQSYTVQPSDITLAEGQDLAVVKFTSNTKYPVATLGDYSLKADTFVFVGGFPARERIDSPLWQWQLNAGSIFDKEQGKLQTQDITSFTEGYDLIYSSISYGGMSGGPVFDTEGRVLGIHGKAEGDTGGNEKLILGNSLGISIQNFIGIAERLKITPKSLKRETNIARVLKHMELATVGVLLLNITQPQPESSGEQWLQYGNQLYRIAKYTEAVRAFDTAIAKDNNYKLLGNYGKALVAWYDEKFSQALTNISAAIDSVPLEKRKQYYYLWKYKSAIYRKLEKFDDAIKAIDAAINLKPDDIVLMNEKAIIFLESKKHAKAILIYDELIKNKPESYTYSNRGNAKDGLGDKRGAILDYNRAISINPNYAEAYYNRGIAKSELGDKREAISDYDRAISVNPNLVEAYINRGLIKYNLGDKQGANLDYDRAISINPNHPNHAEAYSNRGNIKSDLGDKQGAILDYDRAISINPKYATAYYNRGIAKSNLGDTRGAIVDYNSAISINSENDNFYYNRGIAKSQLGDNQAATLDFSRAISINPNLAEAYYNRGTIKYKLGENQEAILDFNKTISINPNDADVYHNRGLAKSKLGDKRGAMIDYDRAISINPNNSQVLYARGNIKSELADKRGAILDYDRAISINSNNDKYYMSRGTAKSSLGDKQGAILDYDRTISINPNDPIAYSARGIAKSYLGDKQGAILDYDRTISINPNDPIAYSARGIAKSYLGDKKGAILDLTTGANLFRQQGKMDLYQQMMTVVRKIEN